MEKEEPKVTTLRPDDLARLENPPSFLDTFEEDKLDWSKPTPESGDTSDDLRPGLEGHHAETEIQSGCKERAPRKAFIIKKLKSAAVDDGRDRLTFTLEFLDETAGSFEVRRDQFLSIQRELRRVTGDALWVAKPFDRDAPILKACWRYVWDEHRFGYSLTATIVLFQISIYIADLWRRHRFDY